MKIVVDVPERDFGIYCRMVDEGMANEAVRRIVNGTPLPKGHGRLIDADALKITEDYDGIDAMNAVYSTPTIVEADEETKE